WFDGGDPAIVDWLIIGELILAAAAHFLLTLLAVSRHDRIRDANPLSVMALLYQLDFRQIGIVMLASLVGVVHLPFLWDALQMLHARPTVGCLQLVGCWISGLFFATFFLRWLGLSCYWNDAS